MADTEGDSQTQRIPEPGKATEINLSNALADEETEGQRLRLINHKGNSIVDIGTQGSSGPPVLFPSYQTTSSFL